MGTKAQRKAMRRAGIKVEIVHAKPELILEKPAVAATKAQSAESVRNFLASAASTLAAQPRWSIPRPPFPSRNYTYEVNYGELQLRDEAGPLRPRPEPMGFNQIRVMSPEGPVTVEHRSSDHAELENHMRDSLHYTVSAPPASAREGAPEGSFVETQRERINAILEERQRLTFGEWDSLATEAQDSPVTADMLNAVVGRLGRAGAEGPPANRAGGIQAFMDVQAQFGIALDQAVLEEEHGVYQGAATPVTILPEGENLSNYFARYATPTEEALPYERLSEISQPETQGETIITLEIPVHEDDDAIF